MNTWYFVAGEQVITVSSRTVLDAWLKIEIRARRYPIASEFQNLLIEAYSVDGVVVAKRSWQQWHDAVLQDTYGDNFREILDAAVELA